MISQLKQDLQDCGITTKDILFFGYVLFTSFSTLVLIFLTVLERIYR